MTKKKKPQDKAREHARRTARSQGGVTACPYKKGSWQTVWLEAFQQAQQRQLFE